ncbi:hypothetical protein Mal15_56750 [Stieleria maiorica]|uniref:Helix-turn-helix domain-containing protein n=1 Tax=Stieleria maiorica TaxID=2795974 RepID=A0A5B9MRE1_9BACT|nr:hypothetical protein Mal15_56750 [Stieleria maiorica]
MNRKRKSDRRWESGRWIHGELLPSLETPGQAAVAMFCWFHAWGEKCEFNATAQQIKDAVHLSTRQVKRILKELERGGVIKTVSVGVGRGNPSVRQFTGKLFTKRENEKRCHECHPLTQ